MHLQSYAFVYTGTGFGWEDSVYLNIEGRNRQRIKNVNTETNFPPPPPDFYRVHHLKTGPDSANALRMRH